MRETNNQPIRFQYSKLGRKRETLKQTKHFQRLNINIYRIKKRQKMESLPIVPSRRQFGTVLILKMFRYRRKKNLNTVFITDVSILIANLK